MSTETGHDAINTTTRHVEVELTAMRRRLSNIEKMVTDLHEVVFTMLKGMEDARNTPGVMGMMAKNMLPEIPDLSQFTSNGHQGD